MKVLDAIRSAIFLTGYGLSVALFSVIGQLFRLTPARTRGPVILLWNRSMLLWLRICCGIKWQLHGELPSTQYVALSKHQSEWETICLQHLLYPVSIVLKRELLSIPFFGWTLALMDPVPIDRGSPKDAIRNMLRSGHEKLANGFNVLIFPEGTRTHYGKPGRYARGGAALAIESHQPVLPIAHNAGKFWPADSWIKSPGTIHVVIGPLLDSGDRNSRDLISEVETWIESTSADIERGLYD